LIKGTHSPYFFLIVIGKVNWEQDDIEANYQIIMDQMKALAQERFVKKGKNCPYKD